MVRVPEAQSDRYWARGSRATYTWFQNHIVRVPKACQTTVMRGKAKLRTYNLKKTSPLQSRSQAVVCVSTPRMYPRSEYFLVSIIFRLRCHSDSSAMCEIVEMVCQIDWSMWIFFLISAYEQHWSRKNNQKMSENFLCTQNPHLQRREVKLSTLVSYFMKF